MLDLEANFLLASSAGGRMPRHLQVEAGFEEDLLLLLMMAKGLHLPLNLDWITQHLNAKDTKDGDGVDEVDKRL